MAQQSSGEFASADPTTGEEDARVQDSIMLVLPPGQYEAQFEETIRTNDAHLLRRVRPPSESMFGKGQPQKWPGFTPPRSRKMPPFRGLLLLRRVQQETRSSFHGGSG